MQHENQTLPFPTEKNSKEEWEKIEEKGETNKQNGTKHTATNGKISRSFKFFNDAFSIKIIKRWVVG